MLFQKLVLHYKMFLFSSINESTNITLIVQVTFANKVGSNKGLISIIYYTPVQNIAYFWFDFTFCTPFILTVSVTSTSSSITCNIYVKGTKQNTTPKTVTSYYSIQMNCFCFQVLIQLQQGLYWVE